MIEFSRLTKCYPEGKLAVDDFSLSVDAPIFGFLGQNGAGKTTIMKMIVGLLAPTSGTITIDGIPSASSEAKSIMGYMPEQPAFYERMTGMEFLKFCGELFPEAPAGGRDYAALLDRVNLGDAKDSEIGTYSKGMRQRLGFAQALVNRPKHLFLDEPLDGLDPIGRREMKEVMLGFAREGSSVFLNTHILADVEELCNEVGIIDKGKLLYAGGVKELCGGKPLEERFVEIVEANEGARTGSA